MSIWQAMYMPAPYVLYMLISMHAQKGFRACPYNCVCTCPCNLSIGMSMLIRACRSYLFYRGKVARCSSPPQRTLQCQIRHLTSAQYVLHEKWVQLTTQIPSIEPLRRESSQLKFSTTNMVLRLWSSKTPNLGHKVPLSTKNGKIAM